MRLDNEDAWVSAYIYSWLYLTFPRDHLFGFVLDEIFSKLSWRNVGTIYMCLVKLNSDVVKDVYMDNFLVYHQIIVCRKILSFCV